MYAFGDKDASATENSADAAEVGSAWRTNVYPREFHFGDVHDGCSTATAVGNAIAGWASLRCDRGGFEKGRVEHAGGGTSVNLSAGPVIRNHATCMCRTRAGPQTWWMLTPIAQAATAYARAGRR